MEASERPSIVQLVNLGGPGTPDSGEVLSVGGQVCELIQQASNPELLGLLWIGWAAYL